MTPAGSSPPEDPDAASGRAAGAPDRRPAPPRASTSRPAGAPPPADASTGAADGPGREPCLRCGLPLPVRLMGCKGGHCPNCGHPYPHGDCSD